MVDRLIRGTTEPHLHPWVLANRLRKSSDRPIFPIVLSVGQSMEDS